MQLVAHTSAHCQPVRARTMQSSKSPEYFSLGWDSESAMLRSQAGLHTPIPDDEATSLLPSRPAPPPAVVLAHLHSPLRQMRPPGSTASLAAQRCRQAVLHHSRRSQSQARKGHPSCLARRQRQLGIWGGQVGQVPISIAPYRDAGHGCGQPTQMRSVTSVTTSLLARALAGWPGEPNHLEKLG